VISFFSGRGDKSIKGGNIHASSRLVTAKA